MQGPATCLAVHGQHGDDGLPPWTARFGVPELADHDGCVVVQGEQGAHALPQPAQVRARSCGRRVWMR
ncbi:hypothetical protein [Streptomyces sp. NPDC093970]|uniref:hypothetical protein n=1 Tax=Streptomyces sp. NPDC093970 TaxID=3155076 RepID=UPI00341CAD48